MHHPLKDWAHPCGRPGLTWPTVDSTGGSLWKQLHPNGQAVDDDGDDDDDDDGGEINVIMYCSKIIVEFWLRR